MAGPDRRPDSRLAALRPDVDADRALLVMLVHVASADGGIDDEELGFLRRVLPGRDPAELRAWAEELGRTPFDPRSLAPALPTLGDRWRALRFATRMAWKDGHLDPSEQALIQGIADALGLPAVAVAHVVGELSGRGRDRVGGERIVQALEKIGWDAVDWGVGVVASPLREVAPAEATPVAWVGVDESEQVGLFQEGLCANFVEGPAWVAYRDLVSWTRQPSLAVALQLHTEDGQAMTIADFRLSGLGALLTWVLDAEPVRAPADNPPVVERLRGE